MQLLAKKIIYSYLNLLVNSKNDLALAHILNIPDRGLGREAFTDLKHAAQENHMSIFLVWTCYIFKSFKRLLNSGSMYFNIEFL